MLTAALCLGSPLVSSGCADEPLLDPDGPGDELGARAEELGGAARLCESVVTLEHRVPVGGGVRLRVVEKFSGRTVVARPRRAILMLTATLVTTAQYDTAVPGDESFDAMARLARAGFDVFSVDYEGYGGSTRPPDGRTVTAERSLEQMGVIVEWIRRNRRVAQVDLFGASLGSSLAMALGSEGGPVPTSHIGRIVLTSVVYREVTPLFQSVFFTPELRAFLESAPGGYVQTDPGAYGIILAAADPAAAAWAASAFPGTYAVGPTLEGFDLPVFDASTGRVPALQVWGDADLVTPRSDVDLFQAEWGGRAELLVLPGGGHAPTLEPVREAMWTGVLRFLGADPAPRCPPGGPR
jgi:pimeloyl-ACP methyl ester carboxylesterase